MVVGVSQPQVEPALPNKKQEQAERTERWVIQQVSKCRIKKSQRVNRGATTCTCTNQYYTYLSFNPELNRILGVDKKLQFSSRSSISTQ